MISTSARVCVGMTPFISCNIYVSAGKPRHIDLLLDLLQKTQLECSGYNINGAGNLNTDSTMQESGNAIETSSSCFSSTKPSSSKGGVVVVHAFSDSSYDRSSFHIAGYPAQVERIASNLIVAAIRRLSEFEEEYMQSGSTNDSATATSTPHPTVGLVDHVSVLPLCEHHEPVNTSSNLDPIPAPQPPITGQVAKSIGNIMRQQCGIDVLYYGYADPDNTPLAVVRRDRTNFFKSSRPTDGNVSGRDSVGRDVKISGMAHGGQATVGAPPYFSENYNIRLHPHIDKTQAQMLTKCIRERSGGLKFVEALTLPYYSNKKGGVLQYEVACNLLNPNVSSTRDIDRRAERWEKEIIQKGQFNIGSNNKSTSSSHGDEETLSSLIEKSYRVGTTIEMCRHALEQTKSKDAEEKYNSKVFNKLKGYLTGSEQ